ncbi:MAG: methionine gamma-lyase family protein [Oscillospiraceae bacterium]|jgi:cystathionine beta-lyase family protein involved in aluminum resistance|nr:methionine gamma-lyase family protein [Oscillospiraceae bacterium]
MSCFVFDNKILDLADKAEKMSRSAFLKINKQSELHQQRVLKAFIDQRVSSGHFFASTGYGYNDYGRDCIDKVFAQVLCGEDAIVRHNFASGTHAITTALFGVLRPGDKMLSITGEPYDTLMSVIGFRGGDDCSNSLGSLKDFGIDYSQVDFCNDSFDINKIKTILKEQKNIKLVYIQRSKGYSFRRSLSTTQIKNVSAIVKSISPQSIIMCDNCYCEFVETIEPLYVGADLVAGSLIKNPGGGIAPCGGYIAGKKKLINQCANRFTNPGVGKEMGATLGLNKKILMGVFNAPIVTGEALKTAIFAAAIFEILSFEVNPNFGEARFDIVQAIKLKNEKSLLAFCRGIQKASPIDSFVTPEPWFMPGYDCKVVMAAGTFNQGSSIELSADAPLKDPFTVWVQGSLNFFCGKIAILSGLQELFNEGCL